MFKSFFREVSRTSRLAALYMKHFPRYVLMRRPISISTNEEELSIVSSNVRLLTPSDQGSR